MHLAGVARVSVERRPPQWRRVHPAKAMCNTGEVAPTPAASRQHPAGGAHSDPAHSTHMPEDTCGHTLNAVLKMNPTGSSSLYMLDMAIIHFLFQYKDL